MYRYLFFPLLLEFVTLTGCKLCGIRLLNPGFFRASHANFIGHKNRLRKLKELIGLSTGEVLGKSRSGVVWKIILVIFMYHFITSVAKNLMYVCT